MFLFFLEGRCESQEHAEGRGRKGAREQEEEGARGERRGGYERGGGMGGKGIPVGGGAGGGSRSESGRGKIEIARV